MKPSKYSQVSIRSLLRRVNAADIFRALGANEDSIIETKEAFRTRCFMHGDTDAYSLTSEKETYETYCLDLSCPLSRLNNGGGNFIEVYAIIKGISYDEALEDWAKRANFTLELKAEEESAYQKDLSLFNYVEVGRFEEAQGTEGQIEMKPLQLVVDGLEVVGRGLVIPLSSLRAVSERYPSNLYCSRFQYDTADIETIRRDGRKGELYLLGNYYIVFEADTSSAIVHAINQAIELVERLNTDYQIPLEAVSIYYSYRTIEIEVDYTAFGITPRPKLDRVFSEMTKILMGGEGKEQEKRTSGVSYQVYSYDSLTLVPGSRSTFHGRDTYKIRLPYHIFKKTSYQRLHELSQRKPDLAEKALVENASRRGRELFERAVRIVEGEVSADEQEAIATIFYRAQETGATLTASTLAPTLLKRLFSESRQILKSPSPYLNNLLSGGFYPGRLYLIGGFPGTGITSFTLWLLLNIAESEKIPCVFVSLQVGIEELFERAIAYIGKIDLTEIAKKRLLPSEFYTDTQFHKSVFAAYARFQELTRNVSFLEGIKMANLEQMRRIISEVKREGKGQNGVSNVFVVIDSLQLLLAHVKALSGSANSSYNTNMLTGILKAMARELDVTFCVTSEFYGDAQVLGTPSTYKDTELTELLENSQFADMVAVLSSLGCTLEPLVKYYEHFDFGIRAEEAKATLARLKKIESDFTKSDLCREKNSVFTVLNVIKNRGGFCGKPLFIYHRSIADFEPVEYTSLTTNGQ